MFSGVELCSAKGTEREPYGSGSEPACGREGWSWCGTPGDVGRERRIS